MSKKQKPEVNKCIRTRTTEFAYLHMHLYLTVYVLRMHRGIQHSHLPGPDLRAQQI